MGTSQHRHSGSKETGNFERMIPSISHQIQPNPTNSGLKNIFQVGPPMSLPLRQSQRVNSKNKRRGSSANPQPCRDLPHNATPKLDVGCSMFQKSHRIKVNRTKSHQGGGGGPQPTPATLDPRPSTLPNRRAPSCPIVDRVPMAKIQKSMNPPIRFISTLVTHYTSGITHRPPLTSMKNFPTVNVLNFETNH